MTEFYSPITPTQTREARRLTGRARDRVCRDLQITRTTLLRAESPRAHTSRYLGAKLQRYYEAAGVEFTTGEQTGVRLST